VGRKYASTSSHLAARPRRGVKGEGGEGEREREREKGRGETYEREGWECTLAAS